MQFIALIFLYSHAVLPFDLENNALPAINVEDGDSYSVGTSNKVNVTWSEYALTGGFLSEYSVTLNISMVSNF